MMGPIDYIVLGFKGNSFDGSIMDELSKAVKHKIIRVVDLMFIMKDKDGNVLEAEYDDQPDEFRKAFGAYDLEDEPLLTHSDVEKLSVKMDKNTAAGVLVIEHLWAKGLKKAIADAGGFLIEDGRIHTSVIEDAKKNLKEAKV